MRRKQSEKIIKKVRRKRKHPRGTVSCDMLLQDELHRLDDLRNDLLQFIDSYGQHASYEQSMLLNIVDRKIDLLLSRFGFHVLKPLS